MGQKETDAETDLKRKNFIDTLYYITFVSTVFINLLYELFLFTVCIYCFYLLCVFTVYIYSHHLSSCYSSLWRLLPLLYQWNFHLVLLEVFHIQHQFYEVFPIIKYLQIKFKNRNLVTYHCSRVFVSMILKMHKSLSIQAPWNP